MGNRESISHRRDQRREWMMGRNRVISRSRIEHESKHRAYTRVMQYYESWVQNEAYLVDSGAVSRLTVNLWTSYAENVSDASPSVCRSLRIPTELIPIGCGIENSEVLRGQVLYALMQIYDHGGL